MHYRHKNFSIDVTEIFCMDMDGLQGSIENLEESLGNTIWYLSGHMLKDWAEEEEEATEMCSKLILLSDLSEYENDPEGLLEFIRELDGDEWIDIGNHPDLLISICTVLKDNGREYRMECNTQHLYWVIHDLHHADDGDVFGCEGNITSGLEASRLMSAMHELWDEHGRYFDDLEVEALEGAFRRRFGSPLRSYITDEDLKYLYRYEEEEVDYDE